MVNTRSLLDHTKATNREFKSSAFTTYYSIPENAADLYRALDHTDDIGPEDIVFTTLDGALFLARKNGICGRQ